MRRFVPPPSRLIDKDALVAYRHDGVWASMNTFNDEQQRLEQRTARGFVADADRTRNAFRNHLVLEYETPKYDGDSGSPNLVVELDDELVRTKTEISMRVFGKAPLGLGR